MPFLAEGRSSSNVDLSTMFDASVCEYFAELAGLGVLVSFGSTSDGGALMFQLTYDGDYRREYFRDPIEFTDYLSEAAKALTAELSRPSPATRPRKRRQKPV